MSVLGKDPTIKLFGKTIPLPLSQAASIPVPPAASSDLFASHNSSHRLTFISATAHPEGESADEEDEEETSRKSVSPENQEVGVPDRNPEPTTSSGISENSRTSPVERETSVDRETLEVKPSTTGEQSKTDEKTLKKPDKLLPCPRCDSMKTKFCYYNNYNVNQPRHFCKNCQRYWTAGGTMRSVPVGAGRRKNKNSSISPYRQLMVSISQVHKLDTPNASNGTVLSFGSSPSKPQNWIPNFSTDQIGEDHSSRSSITGSNSSEKGSQTIDQEQMAKRFKPFPPQMPTFTPQQWGPQFQPPFFPSSSFPVSFYPIPFWGCSPPSSWVLPSLPPPSLSASNSPASMAKTLRIDGVSGAAKSSVNGGKLFQGFQSKGDEKSHVQTSPVLQANPAALSRSNKFHERT